MNGGDIGVLARGFEIDEVHNFDRNRMTTFGHSCNAGSLIGVLEMSWASERWREG